MRTFRELRLKKNSETKITMVTCYDYWSAKILKETNVDVLLVGDSLSMVVHGFESTLHCTIELMEAHTAAVARANTGKLIVADLPFLSHRMGKKHLMECADRLMKAGAHALKIEVFPGQEKWVSYLSESGIPMVGHVGLTPQYVHQFGGYKVQGRDAEQKRRILEQAVKLAESGCHSVVLECVPSDLAKDITERLDIPTIGIGAGKNVDGQVLVLQDLLGLNIDFKPRFVRQFAKGDLWLKEAIDEFDQSVQTQSFPNEAETFQ